MRAYETDIKRPSIEMDHRNQPKPVASNIENIPVIASLVGGIESLFDILKARPVRRSRFSVPFVKGIFGIGMDRRKLVELGFGNDDHVQSFLKKFHNSKFLDKSAAQFHQRKPRQPLDRRRPVF